MPPLYYNILHVISLLLLTGFTFAAFAAPTPERKKKSVILTGIFSLLALVGGGGLHAKLPEIQGLPVWLIVKIVCWLGITILAASVYRRPGMAETYRWAVIAMIVIAVVMIYVRPWA